MMEHKVKEKRQIHFDYGDMTLAQFLADINAVKNEFNLTDHDISLREEGYYDYSEFYFVFERPETDDERIKREAKEVKAAERREKDRIRNAEKRKKRYLELKKEFATLDKEFGNS
jgi:hypothetical protein